MPVIEEPYPKLMALFRQWFREADEEEKQNHRITSKERRTDKLESKQRMLERKRWRLENRITKLTIENLAYQRLLELKNPYKEKEIIAFPDVFSKICTTFHLPKDEAFTILRQMEEQGLIEIVPRTGIRI